MASWKGRALWVPLRPRADSRAGLNTDQAYACPMERCTDRAAGGTSQRLQPGGATGGLMIRTIGTGRPVGKEPKLKGRPYAVSGKQGATNGRFRPMNGRERPLRCAVAR
ncbi:hypothetical protein GCM10010145_16440 [Streptomyces ruber]|uniref:Uncharacterized protein n=2 Tax=Streptomyces TaxID=1883 RepID=A0A918B995_9ACTN|nr:hypothetical protein GCM10010145_16440 [Streptomyces ruber]